MEAVIHTTPEHTALQVQTCLNVLANLVRMVEEETGGLGTSTVVSLDKNVRTCLEATIIRTTTRLDKILDDDKRWELPPDAMKHADTALSMQNVLLSHEMQLSALKLEHIKRGRDQYFADLAAAQQAEQAETVTDVEAEQPQKRTRRKRK